MNTKHPLFIAVQELVNSIDTFLNVPPSILGPLNACKREINVFVNQESSRSRPTSVSELPAGIAIDELTSASGDKGKDPE